MARTDYQAEFVCPKCSAYIIVKTWKALLEGPGLEIACRACRQTYVLDMNGATPISEPIAREFRDAADNPYEPFGGERREPPPYNSEWEK